MAAVHALFLIPTFFWSLFQDQLYTCIISDTNVFLVSFSGSNSVYMHHFLYLYAPFLTAMFSFYYIQDPKDTPPPTRVETKDERKERKVYMR